MKFELGKYYEHSGWGRLYICGVMNSHMYGMCFIGEDQFGNFSPVGTHEDNAQNYSEIDKDRFLSPLEVKHAPNHGQVDLSGPLMQRPG